MIGKIVKSIFGSKNDRELKKIEPLVDRINELEPEFKTLSDEQLQGKTACFRERLSKGETLDDILPEAFAAVREASMRTLGMRHYDVQIIGGIVLHHGKIAEMKTGEGKTLAATLPLYLNALAGRGAQLITVNDYLAKRDAEWMTPVFKALDLSVGIIVHGLDDKERKQAYACDITYGTNNEFGFDYLRDNMKFDKEDFVQRDFYYTIVDEVDSILIDESRTPLIISGPVEHSETKIYDDVKPLVINLRSKQSGVIQALLKDAQDKLDKGDTSEDTIQSLLQIKRGDPKNPQFLKILSQNQALKKQIEKLEGFMSTQKLLPQIDAIHYCTIDERNNSVELTDKGIKLTSSAGFGDFVIPDLDEESHNIRENPELSDEEKQEQLLELESRYIKSSDLLHATHQVIKAYWLFEKDVHYVIKDGQVVIVDEFTGRMMPGRRWSDGLHQAVEAKEGVRVAEENQTLASITFQNYFRMYEKLAGMTGTADTEAAEFNNIYKLDVVVIPTNKNMIRKDYPDSIYRTEREKFNAIVMEIKNLYDKGQPVLVGTITIEKSEKLSKLLKKSGVPHSVLNAKHHEKEAEIVAMAGQKKTVTISTNMAGRGTDIVLGEGVKELGGLHIIGTERHESRRIDNQLRGRSGRQGDPGSSRFYLSLEDDLLRIFGSDRISGIMERLGMEEGEPIEHAIISRAIEGAQKKVEGHNFDIRKHLLDYDNVMNRQREIIYQERKKVLQGESIDELINDIIDTEIDALVQNWIDPKEYPENWGIENLIDNVLRLFGFRPRISAKDIGEEEFHALKPEDLSNMLKEQVAHAYKEKEKMFGREELEKIGRFIILKIIDDQWVEHLQNMDDLKEGIGLRGFGQLDPLKEYQKEGFALFEELMGRISENTLTTMFRIQLMKERSPREIRPRRRTLNLSHGGESPAVTTVKRKGEKVGRNDPCPCGSGKKHKKCCGT